MNRALAFTFCSALALAPAPSSSGGAPAEAVDGRPFAVVELFTSEGCSSCPPADALLGKLVKESRESGEALYPLAFHVDYWDRQGWKDRFSNPAYSRRQYEYSRVLGLGTAYTPQIIVNGTQEFVGSNETRARESITAALKQPAKLTLTLATAPAKDGALPVDFTILGKRRVVVCLALVERKLQTQVSAGENSGRDLSHENVVRGFASVTPGRGGKGHVSLPLPDSLVLSNASLIAYAQDPARLEILGATAVDLH